MIGVRRWALSRGWWGSWGGTERRLGRSGRGYYISPTLWASHPCRWRQSAGHLVGTVCARCWWDIVTDWKVAHLCLHWGLPRWRVEDVELGDIPAVRMGRRGGGWLWEHHSVLGVAAGEVVEAAVSRERGTTWGRRVVDGRGGGRGRVLWEEAIVRSVFSWGGGGCGRAVRGEVVIQVRLWRGRLGTLSMGSKKRVHIRTRVLGKLWNPLSRDELPQHCLQVTVSNLKLYTDTLLTLILDTSAMLALLFGFWVKWSIEVICRSNIGWVVSRHAGNDKINAMLVLSDLQHLKSATEAIQIYSVYLSSDVCVSQLIRLVLNTWVALHTSRQFQLDGWPLTD